MAKSRKTLKHKQRADQRRHVVSERSTTVPPSIDPQANRATYTYESSSQPTKRVSYAVSLQDTAHLFTDLRKTLMVTGGIVLAQLILFYVMNNLGK